ncbi:homing endonuclease associated repeat-containing protein [Salinigranum halophilum]|uniref:homing endonuclease associated repeat-containing protein n=1 Tax=Salinigranum halophilum TaxID=2565931 RepID=UPI00115CFA2E|nr:hypothetical protein [Salinigranum halophilum]
MTNIQRLVSNAAIDYEADLLTSTGKSGLFSTGYLATKPLIEYLNSGEIPLVVFTSPKESPSVQNGDEPVVEFPSAEGYQSFGVVTDSRILLLTGNDDGDVSYSFSLMDIDTVSVETTSSFLSSQARLVITTVDGVEAVTHRLTSVDPHEAAEVIVEKANENRCVELTDRLEESAQQLAAGDSRRDSLEILEQAADRLFTVTSYNDAQTGEADSLTDSGRRLQELRGQVQSAQTALSKLQDVEDTIQDGDDAVQIGSSNAIGHYETALDQLQSLQTVVEKNELPFADILLGRIQKVNNRLENHRPTTTHERLHKLLTKGRDAIAQADRTDGPKDRLEHLQTAVETLREYAATVKDAGFEGGVNKGERCEICQRPTSVRCETHLNSDIVYTCLPCRSFGAETDEGLLLSAQVTKQIDECERRLGQTLADSKFVLYANGSWSGFPGSEAYSKRVRRITALICLTDALGRVPSYNEATTRFPDGLSPPHDYYDFAAEVGVRLDEAFLDQLREQSSNDELAPTADQLIEESAYPRSQYEKRFGSINSAIEKAGVRFGQSDSWVPAIREYYETHRSAPTPDELEAEFGVEIGDILLDAQTWREALLWAGIPERDIVEEDPIRDEALRIEGELEHRPTVEEIRFYFSYPTRALRRYIPRGESLEEVLDRLSFQYPERSLEPTGDLDESPDSASDIPSHTDLLREALWLVRRHGQAKCRAEFADLSMFDIQHYDVQFGSPDAAIERAVGLSTHDPTQAEYAPKVQLAEEIEEFGDFLGRSPKPIELLLYGSVSVDKFAQKFESMAELSEAAGHSWPQSIPSNEALLSDLKRVAVPLGSPPTLEQYAQNGEYPYEHLVRRFDDWFGVLRAAGFSPLSEGNPVLEYHSSDVDLVRFDADVRVRTGLGRDEILIDEIYRIAYELGGRPTPDSVQTLSQYPIDLYAEEFGSVQNAIEVADLEDLADVDPAVNAHVRGDLRTALQALIEESPHPPLSHVVSAELQYSTLSFITVFGSFENALKALGYSADELPTATKPELLEAFSTVMDQLDEVPTPQQLHRHSRFAAQDFVLVFETWHSVYDEASVERPSEMFGSTSSEANESQQPSEPVSEFEFDSEVESESGTRGTEENESGASPTRAELIEAIQSTNERVSGPLKSSDLNAHSPYSQHQFTTEFGSIEEALEHSGIDRREQCLDEIGFVIDEIGRFPNQADVGRHARVSGPFINRYFDDWLDALTAFADRQGLSGKTASDELLLGEIERLGSKQADAVMPSQIEQKGVFEPADYVERFGSWPEALNSAGIEAETELLESIRRLRRDADGPLTEQSLERSDRFDTDILDEVFGSLEAAIDAYVESYDTDIATTSNAVAGDESDEQQPASDESTHQAGGAGTRTETPDSPTDEANENTSDTGSEPTSNDELREALIETLRDLHNELAHPVMSYDISEKTSYSQYDYSSEFGSLDNAFEAAGIDRTDSFLCEYHRVALEVGELPSKATFDEHAHFSYVTLVNRLGDWDEIQARYREWVEGRSDSPGDTEIHSGSREAQNDSDADSKGAGSSSTERETGGSLEEESAPANEFDEPVETVTFSDVAVGSQYDQPIAVRLVATEPETASDVDALLTVEDTSGERVQFRVLTGHSPGVDWTVGDWYEIQRFWSGNKYKNGEPHRYLLSTERLSAQQLDTAEQANEDSTDHDKDNNIDDSDELMGSIDEQLDELLGET